MHQTIPESHSLDSATFASGVSIPVYDDGRGPLWIVRDSMGVDAIIRADTWEEAWGIWEDEFAPEADEATYEEMAKECDYNGPIDLLYQSATWQENYGTRPNGANKKDKHGHGIYQRDLNGIFLEELSPELMGILGITLTLSEAE